MHESTVIKITDIDITDSMSMSMSCLCRQNGALSAARMKYFHCDCDCDHNTYNNRVKPDRCMAEFCIGNWTSGTKPKHIRNTYIIIIIMRTYHLQLRSCLLLVYLQDNYHKNHIYSLCEYKDQLWQLKENSILWLFMMLVLVQTLLTVFFEKSEMHDGILWIYFVISYVSWLRVLSQLFIHFFFKQVIS